MGKWDEAKVDSIVDMLTSPDQLNLNHFLTVQQAYEEAGDIWEKLGQLNTHTYSGTNEERLQVRELVARAGKPFWQLETGPSLPAVKISDGVLSYQAPARSLTTFVVTL